MHLPLRDADLIVAGKPVALLSRLAGARRAGRRVVAAGRLQRHCRRDHRAREHGRRLVRYIPAAYARRLRPPAPGREDNPIWQSVHGLHTSPGMFPYMVRDSLAWFRTYLLGEKGLLRKAPVRVFVMGRNKWKSLPDWPPGGYQPQRWFLQPGRGLAPQPAGAGTGRIGIAMTQPTRRPPWAAPA